MHSIAPEALTRVSMKLCHYFACRKQLRQAILLLSVTEGSTLSLLLDSELTSQGLLSHLYKLSNDYLYLYI